MAIQINVVEAKAKLSALLDAAERGEDVVIARAGVPVARLVAMEAERPAPRLLGVLKRMGYKGDADNMVFAPEPADALDSAFPTG